MADGFRIEIANEFKRSTRKLDNSIIERLNNALVRLVQDPFIGAPLQGPWRGFFKLRIGEYRLLYTIDAPEKLIILYRFAPRGHVYK